MPSFPFMFDLHELYQVLHLGMLGRIFLAACLGGLIGFEREWSDKPAGLRTNLLICVGAALLSELSLKFAGDFVLNEFVRSDPARLAAQIVSGIGFLGAGTIIQSRGNVTGLTTAATMWVVAAIGIAVGIHSYVIAIGTTIFVLVALIPLGYIENRMIRQGTYWLRIRMNNDLDLLDDVETIFDTVGVPAKRTSLKRDEDALTVRFDTNGPKKHFDRLQREIMSREEVYEVTVKKH